MSFYFNAGKIREICRAFVLPIDEIKLIVGRVLDESKDINIVIDFGAGTLYWSKWLKKVTNGKIIAVDPIFDIIHPKEDVICVTSLKDVPPPKRMV